MAKIFRIEFWFIPIIELIKIKIIVISNILLRLR